MNFLHKLFNPHCEQCRFDAEQERLNKRSELIDEYKEMLASARLETGRLTQALVDLTKVEVPVTQIIKSDFQPLKRKMGMNELAAKLTRESAQMAKELRETKVKESEDLRSKDEIAEMETKLGDSVMGKMDMSARIARGIQPGLKPMNPMGDNNMIGNKPDIPGIGNLSPTMDKEASNTANGISNVWTPNPNDQHLLGNNLLRPSFDSVMNKNPAASNVRMEARGRAMGTRPSLMNKFNKF